MEQVIDNTQFVALAKRVKGEPTQVNRLAFLQALVDTSLIVPMLITPEPIDNKVREDAVLHYFTMKTSKGLNYLVTFTDKSQMDKWNKNPNKMFLYRNYEFIKSLVSDAKSEYDGFVIDPMGINIAIKNDLITDIDKVSRPNLAITPEKIQTEGNMGLTVYNNPPKLLIDELSTHLAKQPHVRAAYIMQTIRSGEDKATPILIIDLDQGGTSLKATFDGVAAVAHSVIKKGESIGLMPAFDKIAHDSIKGVKPFYKKRG